MNDSSYLTLLVFFTNIQFHRFRGQTTIKKISSDKKFRSDDFQQIDLIESEQNCRNWLRLPDFGLVITNNVLYNFVSFKAGYHG